MDGSASSIKMNLQENTLGNFTSSGEAKRYVLHRITRVVSYHHKGCYGTRINWIQREGGNKESQEGLPVRGNNCTI